MVDSVCFENQSSKYGVLPDVEAYTNASGMPFSDTAYFSSSSVLPFGV